MILLEYDDMIPPPFTVQVGPLCKMPVGIVKPRKVRLLIVIAREIKLRSIGMAVRRSGPQEGTPYDDAP